MPPIASVAIEGKFDKWDASLAFKSPDVSTGVLDIKIQADSVNTGNGMKNNKLKSKGFFDVKENPYITFHSTKIVQTGPDTFEVDGDFTIRSFHQNVLPSPQSGQRDDQFSEIAKRGVKESANRVSRLGRH